MWDYHPIEDVHDGLVTVPEYNAVIQAGYQLSNGQSDRYRGGYFFEENSWGRYTHINALKSQIKDEKTDDFKR